MRKLCYCLIAFISFFLFSLDVYAVRGDFVYEVQDVVMNDTSITFRGYAFIHRTQNYVTVYKRTTNGSETDDIVKSGGGQTTKIRIVNNSGKEIGKSYSKNQEDGYNFYYQMFQSTSNSSFGLDTYNNSSSNSCSNHGNIYYETPCYYEDIGFEIKFTIDEILNKFSSGEEISFEIAACNNDYGCTNYVPLKIASLTNNASSDIIKITEGEPNGNIKVVALDTIFQKINEQGKYFNNLAGPSQNDYYNIVRYKDNGYKDGFNANVKNAKDFLTNTKSPGKYVICINEQTYKNGCKSVDNDGYCTNCGGKIVTMYGSWISLIGNNSLIFDPDNPGNNNPNNPDDPGLTITVNETKKCERSSDAKKNISLSCNDSATLKSTCEELTVVVDGGSANVKIEQTGTISSIITPGSNNVTITDKNGNKSEGKIYSGSGFSFGVLYTNTIKWDYVGEYNQQLHELIKKEMINKIYSFDEYKERINFEELKIGTENNYSLANISLSKKCNFDESIKFHENGTLMDIKTDFYKTGLTVSCLFTFPSSIVNTDGVVNYDNIYDNPIITNKYYTPIGYSGKYGLEVIISGLNRIKESSAKTDSADKNNRPWTDSWTVNVGKSNSCYVNVYNLLPVTPTEGSFNYKTINFSYIYRPVDLGKPFPDRNPGINWYEWYSNDKNKDRLLNTYDKLQYSVILDNNTIENIQKYNKEQKGYFDWDTMYGPDNEKSNFIDEYFNVKRDNLPKEGDN